MRLNALNINDTSVRGSRRESERGPSEGRGSAEKTGNEVRRQATGCVAASV